MKHSRGRNCPQHALPHYELHDDFEDDIVLGAAFSIDADYLVTHDERLAKRAPLPCLTVRAALEKVQDANG